MNKFIIVLLMALVVAGCGFNFPSVCDNMTEPSLMCDIARKYNVRVEDIGNVLIVTNAIAIGEGQYTKEQAVGVFREIRSLLDNPITYMALRGGIYDRLERYPGLYEVSDIYLGEFTALVDVYPADRGMLISWLDERIVNLTI